MPEQRNGFTNPMKSTAFFVRQGDSNEKKNKVAATFKTDETGQFSIELPSGSYSVFHADKQLPFNAFRKKTGSSSKYYKEREEPCWQDWYKRPDFQLTVSNDTSVVFTYSSRCYGGFNPCLQYTGPYPP